MTIASLDSLREAAKALDRSIDGMKASLPVAEPSDIDTLVEEALWSFYEEQALTVVRYQRHESGLNVLTLIQPSDRERGVLRALVETAMQLEAAKHAAPEDK